MKTNEQHPHTPDIDIKIALDVVMFTYKHFELFTDNRGKLGKYGIPFALLMLGNMDANSGIIHKFKVKDKAAELGCPVQTVYRLIRLLREIGFANLKLRHGTVSGRVCGRVPKAMLQWWERERAKEDESPCGGDGVPFDPHAMPVGMMHPLQIVAQLKAGTSEAHWRLSMVCSLNIDLQSGKLHTKRPVEWAELACMDRTWAVKGFTHLNEIGVSQVQIGYDIEGRMPFVAMAHGVFQLKKLEAAEGRRGRADSTDTHWKRKQLALAEVWGFQLTGIAHAELEKLWRFLGTETDRLISKQREKFKKEFNKDIPIERGRVFQSAPPGTIPIANLFDQVREGIPPA